MLLCDDRSDSWSQARWRSPGTDAVLIEGAYTSFTLSIYLSLMNTRWTPTCNAICFWARAEKMPIPNLKCVMLRWWQEVAAHENTIVAEDSLCLGHGESVAYHYFYQQGKTANNGTTQCKPCFSQLKLHNGRIALYVYRCRWRRKSSYLGYK